MKKYINVEEDKSLVKWSDTLFASIKLRRSIEKISAQASTLIEQRKKNDKPLVSLIQKQKLNGLMFDGHVFYPQAAGGAPAFRTVVDEAIKDEVISKASYDRLIQLYEDMVVERKKDASIDLRMSEVR